MGVIREVKKQSDQRVRFNWGQFINVAGSQTRLENKNVLRRVCDSPVSELQPVCIERLPSF